MLAFWQHQEQMQSIIEGMKITTGIVNAGVVTDYKQYYIDVAWASWQLDSFVDILNRQTPDLVWMVSNGDRCLPLIKTNNVDRVFMLQRHPGSYEYVYKSQSDV